MWDVPCEKFECVAEKKYAELVTRTRCWPRLYSTHHVLLLLLNNKPTQWMTARVCLLREKALPFQMQDSGDAILPHFPPKLEGLWASWRTWRPRCWAPSWSLMTCSFPLGSVILPQNYFLCVLSARTHCTLESQTLLSLLPLCRGEWCILLNCLTKQSN